jgi:hypothetical protein
MDDDPRSERDVHANHCPGSPDPQLVFLEQLVAERATIAGDVIELNEHTWAIHGSIAVDGDVIMAEYDSEQRADLVLRELAEDTGASGAI